MKKRLLSFSLVLICVCSFSLSAFAKNIENITDKDKAEIAQNPYLWYAKNQMLGVEDGTGVTLVCPNGDYSTLYTGGTLVSCPYDGEALVLASAGGVQAKKYETGGGSAGTGGVGRNPSGYSGTGVPSVAANGEIQYTVYPELGITPSALAPYPTSFEKITKGSSDFVNISVNELACDISSSFSSWKNNYVSVYAQFSLTAPVSGYYYIASEQRYCTNILLKSLSFGYRRISERAINSNYSAGDSITLGYYSVDFYASKTNTSYTAYFHPIVINCIPTTTNITNYNNYTINKNQWNGNIYVDNSTNLTYIYPQYTTINENNETVTNISNNPINVLSNVDLAIPYTKLDSLAQVVKASKTTTAIDDENDTLTVTIVAMDELSVQMNSRSFKDNFNAYFLNTLLCCRHYHISFYGSAQRFQHVDKLLRDVTHTVIQCHKVWRFQLWASYDAWEMENATNAEMIKPLRTGLWFVLDRDYNAYDTLAVVDNLTKKFEEGDILPESEIIANQVPAGPLGLEVASKPTNKAKRRLQTTIKK